jgi:guanylate kinase
LEERLRKRETETPESIARRIGKAAQELNKSKAFDKVILNDDLSKAFAEAEQVTCEFLGIPNKA